MIFDDRWRLCGVIDWEMAFAAPWEIAAEFPLVLTMTPRAMDAPWKHDEMGNTKDAENQQKLVDPGGVYCASEREGKGKRIHGRI